MSRKRIIVFAVGVLLIATAGMFRAERRYHLLSNMSAIVLGQTIQVDNAVRDVGPIGPGQTCLVTFLITNRSAEPIRLVGANCECPLVTPPALPLILAASQATAVNFQVHAPATAERLDSQIELYFDAPLPILTLRIVGVSE